MQEYKPPPPSTPLDRGRRVCTYTCVLVCWVKPDPAHHAAAACSIQRRKICMQCEIFRLELFFFLATHPSCTRRWGATYCQQEASWHLPRNPPPLHKHSIITLCLILLLLKVSKPFYSKSAFSKLTIAFFPLPLLRLCSAATNRAPHTGRDSSTSRFLLSFSPPFIHLLGSMKSS